MIITYSLFGLFGCSKSEDNQSFSVVFFDSFDVTSNWTLHDVSGTSGATTGSATGSISGSKLSMTGQGALVGMPGAGVCGSMEARSIAGLATLEPGPYTVRVSYKGLPLGSAPSGNTLVINGYTFSLVSSTDTSSDFNFNVATATDLDMKLKTYSCDDMGMVLSSSLDVYEIQVLK